MSTCINKLRERERELHSLASDGNVDAHIIAEVMAASRFAKGTASRDMLLGAASITCHLPMPDCRLSPFLSHFVSLMPIVDVNPVSMRRVVVAHSDTSSLHVLLCPAACSFIVSRCELAQTLVVFQSRDPGDGRDIHQNWQAQRKRNGGNCQGHCANPRLEGACCEQHNANAE